MTNPNNNHILSINSFNTRGIRNKDKRKNIFNWLRNSHYGIAMLQETHAIETDHSKWKREWDGEIIFSDGESNSKGVATLIPKELLPHFSIIKTEQDNHGRLLLIHCTIHKTELVLINIYSPTKDKPYAQNTFYTSLYNIIDRYSDKSIIIGGDLNTYLNIEKDKKGGKQEKQSPFAENLENLCEEFSLLDIWRVRNQNMFKYTRIERSRNGIVQSRLDYFLISMCISYQIHNTSISPGNSSDHSIITISLNILDQSKRGKGYWKFNNNLLTDTTYVEIINNTLLEIKNNINMTDKNQLWEYTKCQLRTDTIIYSSKKAKENKEIEIKLKKKVEQFEQKLSKSNDIGNLEYMEYVRSKSDWEGHIQRKNNGIILRSKAKWIEDGEKNTKYFLNLEKRNYNNTCIKTLINNDKKEITDTQEIIKEQKNFYQNLYTSKIPLDNIYKEKSDIFTLNKDLPKVSEDNKEICDLPIALEECSKALQQLPNNKSPGSDGFTTNFYKFFWKDIKDMVFQSFQYSYETKKLSSFQRMGILNLLPKKDKDIRYLANWRPVSLLNTDYKILTKLLAIRLQKVIPSIINSDQVGYIKNRYIGENVRILYDLLEYADIEQIEAYITQIDFQKAFDSVEWDFLFKTLETLNFGQNFISWIKTIYTDISSCVGNNGNYSQYFTLSRSIRQGCPISALLFLLVVELLAYEIREDPTIHGITIQNTIFKISMMADDTTLIMKDIQSITNAINIFKDFEKCSGLKLNLNKTEIIPIGNQKSVHTILPYHLREIKIKHGPFKALGVWFTSNHQEMVELNYNERLKNMNTLTNIWQCRNLSLKGKITILRTLILPQIQFLFSMIPTPDAILKKLDKMLFNFLWSNKPAKIKRNTIIGPIELGGLGMIDVYAVHTAAKCSWIRRLFDNTNSKWKVIFIVMLNIKPALLNKNLELKNTSRCLTEFHKQILTSWIELTSKEPFSYKEIINQYILHNRHIKINGEVIKSTHLSNNNTNINDLQIADMINEHNTFLTQDEFNRENNTVVTTLQYNALKSALQKSWKRKITSNRINSKTKDQLKSATPTLKIKNSIKEISIIKSKALYEDIITVKSQPPTVLETWVNLYPFLDNYDWKDIYTIPFKYIREPYLQSFQYKIINRILNTNANLHRWNIKTTNKCTYCNEIDTIEHHLYYCKESRIIWEKLENWVFNQFGLKIKLTVCEILFGLPHAVDNYIELLNFLIILGKKYINHSKTTEQPIYFIELLNLIKNKIDVIILSNNLSNRQNKGWQDTLRDNL